MSELEFGAATDAPGKVNGDSTIPQTVEQLKEKARGVNKDGTPRKPGSGRPRKNAAPSADPGPAASASLGQPGFTEGQVKTTFQGLFSIAALGTDCNVWFLADAEADCFVPSATLALNQTFPQVAQSKWGALTLASLSLAAVVIGKTLGYIQYKQTIKKSAPPLEPSAT